MGQLSSDRQALRDAEQRIAQLESALAPFALAGEWLSEAGEHRDTLIYMSPTKNGVVSITVGDLIEAARVAAKGHNA